MKTCFSTTAAVFFAKSVVESNEQKIGFRALVLLVVVNKTGSTRKWTAVCVYILGAYKCK